MYYRGNISSRFQVISRKSWRNIFHVTKANEFKSIFVSLFLWFRLFTRSCDSTREYLFIRTVVDILSPLVFSDMIIHLSWRLNRTSFIRKYATARLLTLWRRIIVVTIIMKSIYIALFSKSKSKRWTWNKSVCRSIYKM